MFIGYRSTRSRCAGNAAAARAPSTREYVTSSWFQERRVQSRRRVGAYLIGLFTTICEFRTAPKQRLKQFWRRLRVRTFPAIQRWSGPCRTRADDVSSGAADARQILGDAYGCRPWSRLTRRRRPFDGVFRGRGAKKDGPPANHVTRAQRIRLDVVLEWWCSATVTVRKHPRAAALELRAAAHCVCVCVCVVIILWEVMERIIIIIIIIIIAVVKREQFIKQTINETLWDSADYVKQSYCTVDLRSTIRIKHVVQNSTLRYSWLFTIIL
jgi:hypothetical protein